jgi:hypothetical protein
MKTSLLSESYSSAISRFDNYEAKTGIDIAMSINQNKLVYFFKRMIVFDLNKSKLTSLSKIFNSMETSRLNESYSTAISSFNNYDINSLLI